MRTSRLEAFSDGVLAIIITIMVLELNVPEEPSLHALGESATGFLTYALSFVYVGIYWNNHHHMFQVVEAITGSVLWANLHLLFWLSLFPFSTAWMDDTGFARTPTLIYGVNLLLAALAYYALVLT
ncbi:MAG TPA: TMEM175 family protein, partial [Nocardioidaceae bacterium]|nr:TMEM175 family protein [Nocardioidaceae bacterium]